MSDPPVKGAKIRGRQVHVTRTAVPTRMSMGFSMGGMGGMGGGTIVSRSSRMSYGAAPLVGGQGNASTAVTNVIDTKQKEKQELVHLNDRLAKVMENGLHKDAQNKLLCAEIERLKKLKDFKPEALQEMIDNELKAAREEVKNAYDEKHEVDVQLLAAQDKLERVLRELDDLKKDLGDWKNKCNKLNAECSDYDAECSGLRRQLETYEMENEQLNKTIDRLKGELEKASLDLQNETDERMKLLNESQCIQEDLEFRIELLMKENEMLKELTKQDHMPKVKEQISGQFREVMSKMRQENDEIINRMKGEYESSYTARIQQLESGIQKDVMDSGIAREECKRLKTQLGTNKNQLVDLQNKNHALTAEIERLREELDDLNELHESERQACEGEKAKLCSRIDGLELELQRLNDRNLDLDCEIGMYRKLLENEEMSMKSLTESASGARSYGGEALGQLILGGGGGGGGSQQQSTMSSEAMGTLHIQRQSNCPAHITHFDPDGSCVKIENTTKGKAMQLNGWTLNRDYKRGGKTVMISYTFNDYLLEGGKTLMLLAKDCSPKESGPYLICKNVDNWGHNAGTFSLLDDNRKERASCKITLK